jgi:hypothetical protein
LSAPGPKIIGAAPASALDARWEKRAEELEFEALGKVRGAAEKWTATLAALLGLVGTILLVKGPDEVGKLPTAAQYLIGALLLFALIAAVRATVLAAYAAQGTPEDLEYPNGAKLRKEERRWAEESKQKLTASRQITLVAVGLIALAVLVGWVWPQSSSSSGSTVLLTPAQGQPLCGTLVNGPDALELEVGESREALPPGPYDNVIAVEGCPEKEASGGE